MSVGTETGFMIYRGRRPWTWVKRLLNPGNYWSLSKRLGAKFSRNVRVSLKLFPLHFRPQSFHKFSRNKIFPVESRRLTKTLNPLDDFEIDWDRSSEIPRMDAVTVLMKGISFDRSLVDELPGPIYAVNFQEKLDRQDVVYTSTDAGLLWLYIDNDMYPILFLETNRIDLQGNYVARDAGTDEEDCLKDPRIKRMSMYHKAGPQHLYRGGMPSTSGLATVVAAGNLAESVEVYGWDYYLEFSPAQSGYWKSFIRTFVNFPREYERTHQDLCIYDWHYAYRLSHLPNFKIQGYLSGLGKHPGINRRLDRIFYKFPLNATLEEELAARDRMSTET